MGLKRLLTIAGSDSGGGAGIQADLKTFTVLGTYGMSALTAVTAQNTLGVQGIFPLSPEAVATQIDSVLTDIGADAAKTGMLFSAEIITVVATKIKEHDLNRLVVDPVMIAKGGAPLLQKEAQQALKRETPAPGGGYNS
jgi:hydroxymethylpyrimidine/phosphomethylpyrimidine kinase